MGVQAEPYFSAVWRKSKHSSNSGDCLEIASTGASVLVRDSRNRPDVVLEFSAIGWRELLERIRNSA